ncbi:MAG TPA: sarcosine oxidase subunit gamma SoxG [Desulfobacteraceae bacterium]|nr:sarcosine oxidase subunit gamma SoxG [Desulfobacteraceae bacterium]
MTNIVRESPVSFEKTPKRVENRGGWKVAMAYDKETEPCIVDLSHKPRFDLQDGSLSSFHPFGIAVPETPGMSVLENGFLVNRMNRTQASVWHLDGSPPQLPDDPAYTDVTDAAMCVAIMGKALFSIGEKLTSLDFLEPGKKAPFLVQGPLFHVPAQIVVLSRKPESPALIFTCSRGYGRSMVKAIMDAGAEFNLVPAGEERFTTWIKTIV